MKLKKIDKFEEFITSRMAFLIFSFSFISFIFFGLIFLYSPGGSDYWEHLATIYHFSIDPMSTNNAYIASSKPFILNTPFHLFWGLFSKITSVHPFWLLPIIGVLNQILFLIATVYISKFLTNSRRYALLIALTLLFFWYQPWQWSGFYHFGMLPMTSIYPFWFAFPLSLIVISKIGVQKGFIYLSIYTILMSIVFLIHPLTGSFVFFGVFIKALTNYDEPVKNRLLVLLTPLPAFLLCLLWPYYSVGGAIFNISGSRFFLGNYWQFYVQPWKSILPALAGLVYIPIAIKNKQFNFIIIGLLGTIVIFAGNRYTFHNQYLSRYLIYICFFLQISVVMLLKDSMQGLQRRLAYLVFIILLIIFGAKQIQLSSFTWGITSDKKNGTPIGTHSNINFFKNYSKIGEFVSITDIILAPVYESWMLPGILGCHIVASPHAEVFETDDEYKERWNDTNVFFKDSTYIHFSDSPFTNNREEVIKKYDVQYVMVPKSYDYSIFEAIPLLKTIMDTPDYRLYKVQ